MGPLHQTIQVTYRYTVHFTERLFTCENPLLRDVLSSSGDPKSPCKILCIIDRAVSQYHPDLPQAIVSYCQHNEPLTDLVRSPLVVDGGENAKNDMASVTAVQEAICDYGICRHSYVLAIGGGAVLDMVGYAAATAHRGVRLIRVPTTVLAQCDSGIGVKNSINAFGRKNFLGTFAPPLAVLNDAHFLTTLSPRDWRSGISEAIKVALLKDVAFFAFIEREAEQLLHRDMRMMAWLIYRCAQLHLDHIATGGDPFEFGSSRPLDFGHWSAHKLEQLSQYTLRHGEAVAIGIALDATYSYLAGFLPEVDWQRILRLLLSLGFALHVPELTLPSPPHSSAAQCRGAVYKPVAPADIPCVLSGLQEFREHLGGQLTISLLERIGKGIEVNEVDEMTIIKSIALLAEYQAAHWMELIASD